jgi:Copper type II ascorbate-dependent monooxygenase, C-terminal domain
MINRSHSFRLPCVLLAGALALGACGDDDDAKDPDAGTADAGPPPLLEPPPPGQGLQLSMKTSLAPGVEAEHCQFVKAPATRTWVNHDEVRFTHGSHHFLLYATEYTEIPTHKEDGTPVDTSKVFDCSDGATNGWKVSKLIGGSQNGNGDATLRFPPNVAIDIPAGTVLLMNAHYINASDSVLEPEVYMNLWTIPEDKVEVEGDILFLYNPLIKVPANGTGRARWRCPVAQDITIASVQSHMHRRGVGYEAQLVSQEQPFYVSDRWENVVVKRFEPGMVVHAGEVLDYHCDYKNVENRDVYQGARTTDEMCMLIGSFYPKDSRTALCRDENGAIAGEWVGNGAATCAQTWSCLQGALRDQGGLKAMTDCMDVASPEVAAESSALLRCIFRTHDPQMCGAEISACSTR